MLTIRMIPFIVLAALVVLATPAARAFPVAINEFQSSNGETIADEDGDFEDWIELYNAGGEPALLGGYGLSDDEDRPFRWVFPDVSLGPGEFLLVFASNKDRTGGPFLHTNFAISSSGEELLLTAPDGTLVDFVPPTPVPRDVSFGRKPDGAGDWFFFDDPTPGAPNSGPATGEILSPPSFSHEGGFYSDGLLLTLSTDEPGASIVYTLDGSEPDPDNLDGTHYIYKNSYPEFPGDAPGEALSGVYQSHSYENPITIVNRTGQPERLSGRSSTWHRAPPYYWPTEPVFQGTVVRARTVREGALPSRVVTHTYFVTQEGGTRYTLPVLALTVQENHLFGYEEGIYTAGVDFDQWRAQNPEAPAHFSLPANYGRRGLEAEHPLHMEVILPGEGRAWSQNLGVRIHGGATRFYPQKSLRLYARNAYDDTNTMAFPFIPGLIGRGTAEPITEFRRLLLRNSGNDVRRSRLRDAFIQTLVAPIGLDHQGYEPAVHFINGEYWGLINIRERIDQHYIASHYGFDPDSVAIISNQNDISAGLDEDLADLVALRNYAATFDLRQPQHYAHMAERMDIENFILYNMVQIYIKNTDWPWNNRTAWRKRPGAEGGGAVDPADGRWRWILFDTDFGFGTTAGLDASYNMLVHATEGSQWHRIKLRKLLENESFRNRFINAFADHMNTTFQPDRVAQLVEEMSSRIAPYFPEHLDRWRNMGSPDPAFLNFFAIERPAYMREHLIDFFDLGGAAEVTVHMPAADLQGGARVRVNSVALEANGEAWQGTYFQGVPITLEAIPPPGYRFVRWDGAPGNPVSASITLTLDDHLAATPVFEEDDALYAVFAEYHETGQASWPLPPITVEARSSFGEVAGDFVGDITIALASGPGALSGTVTVTAVDGKAAFDDLVVDAPGTYRFRSEADGLAPTETGPIAVAAISPVTLPQFIQGDEPNNDRVPFLYRARIDGLEPNRTYRYANRVASLDEPALQDGAGNALLPEPDTGMLRRNTNSPEFADPSTYGAFKADGTGSFEGWFITEPTGNRRFGEPFLRMRVLLNDGNRGTANHHFLTIPEPVMVLPFGDSTDHGTGLWADGPFTPGNAVFLYGATGNEMRPLAGTVVEATGAEVDSRYASFYQTFVAGRDGHWGTIIPNDLAGGVRRIMEFPWAGGEWIAQYESADGVWTGGVDTVNPSGGVLALPLTDDDRTLELTLIGEVLDMETMEPVPCGVIELAAADQSFRVSAMTDQNGAFFFERLPEGAYTVRIMAPGYESLDPEAVALTGEEVIERDFALVPRELGDARIHGVAANAATGKPLAGVLVESFLIDLFGGGQTLSAVSLTCADGRYELPLPAGAGSELFLVRFSMPGFQLFSQSETINLSEGWPLDALLTPQSAGSAGIAGSVAVLATGGHAAAEDARITLRGPLNTSTASDQTGEYAFEGLPKGSYTVTASAPGYRAFTRQRTLTPGDQATADFLLYSLSGIPGDVNGDGVVNAVDVQLLINAALGIAIDPAYRPDINDDGAVNAVDVQLVINAALGVAAAP